MVLVSSSETTVTVACLLSPKVASPAIVTTAFLSAALAVTLAAAPRSPVTVAENGVAVCSNLTVSLLT